MQSSGFLAVNSAMLVCDKETKFGAIDLGYDIGARQPDPFVFIGADVSIADGTKQVYQVYHLGRALRASKGGGVHCVLEMPMGSQCPMQQFCEQEKHTFPRYALRARGRNRGSGRLGTVPPKSQGSWCVSIRKVGGRVNESYGWRSALLIHV